MAKVDDRTNGADFLSGHGEMAALIAEYDWGSTALGPLSGWPQSLKTATALILDAAIPMALLYGADAVTIYNDAYAVLLGKRHPQSLGSKARESWPDAAALTDQALAAGLAGRTVAFRDLELTIFRSDAPEQVWANIDCSPVRDESGKPVGVLSVVVETTQRVLAERKAALDIEQWRRLFDQAPGFIRLTRGPNHVFEFVNQSYRRLVGDREIVGRSLREVFADVPDTGMLEVVDRVYRTGERYVARAQSTPLRRDPNGPVEEAFLDFILEPVTDDDGRVIGMFVEGFDVTDEVHARAAAEESERRLSAALALARLGVFEWDVETHEAILDPRAREMFGFGPDDRLTVEKVIKRIDASDLGTFFSGVGDSSETPAGRRELEYRIHLPDGSMRRIASVSELATDPHGRPRRVIGVFDDVSEQREAQRRQRLLINELNHRVKNTLATVQSIAGQSLRSATDLPSARAAFEARLMALSAAHDLLTRQSWHGASLADVVAGVMAPFETTHRPQISRAGPPVWLSAPQALALSMALPELATNALKYGALSRPEGRVTLQWTLEGGELSLSWSEAGGPPVTPPGRSGFGMRLLQRNLARELGGEVTLTFAPDGVRCEIRFKVHDRRSARAVDFGQV